MEKQSFYLLLSALASSAPCAESWWPRTVAAASAYQHRGVCGLRCPVAGRRPSGLLAPRRHERGEVTAYLARAAHLEAASVFAFDKLAEDLESLGAPDALINACLRAAREEAVHARMVRVLAEARDACPPGVDVLVRARPTLLELALENVVEGVVREAYGALQASFSGRNARAEDVRSAMATIAVDEAAHAWLALRIAGWVDARLSAEERAQVSRTKYAAIRALHSELDHEPARALRRDLGVPSRAQALYLFDQLTRNVWYTS